ncbi:MAG TPA: hydantoinase B/oxoprolinase family protein [bacterium]|nr:hydantoinase B/oxoprolinase family protein [bacterium]
MPPQSVLLEILKNRFQSIANEMAYNLLRTGHTVFIKETADFGTGIATPEGELFAAPINLGVSVMIGMWCGRAFSAIPEYQEGDVCISNDPYLTGGLSTHLCDVFIWKPIFAEGRLCCFAMGFIHSSDVGGKVPGSISPSCYDIWQEGLRIPPLKLYARGELNEGLLRLLLLNSRIPDQNWGDLKALIGSVNTAERRMHALFTRYGADAAMRGGRALLDYAEGQARRLIEQLPDGDYAFGDLLEGDVVPGGHPIRLELTLRVRGSEIVLDFTGTDPQVRAALNLPTFSQTGHYMIVPGVVNYLRTKDPNLPYNSGLVRPLHIVAPEGSLVNPRTNAACGVRAATMRRAWEVSMGPLSRLDPAYIPAAGGGMSAPVLIACADPDTGDLKVNVAQPLSGGSGARASKDGIEGAEFSSFIRNIPIEVLETEMPVEVLRYALREDSAGAGAHRGGNGLEFTFRCLAPHTILTARGLERFHFRPWGLRGGRAGTPGMAILNPGTPEERNVGKVDVLEMEAGDVIQFLTQGGGGHGSPLARDPDAVAEDVRNQLVTPETARRVYGVVLDAGGHPDLDVTARRRNEVRGAMPEREFDFGPERDAYDAVWTGAVREALEAGLRDAPAAFQGLIRLKAMDEITVRAGGVTPSPEDVARVVATVKQRFVWPE